MSSRSLTYSASSYSSKSTTTTNNKASDRPADATGMPLVGPFWARSPPSTPPQQLYPARSIPSPPGSSSSPPPPPLASVIMVTPVGSPASADALTASRAVTTAPATTAPTIANKGRWIRRRHVPHSSPGEAEELAATVGEGRATAFDLDSDDDDVDGSLEYDSADDGSSLISLDYMDHAEPLSSTTPGLPHTVTIPAPAAPYAQLCYHRAQDRMVTLMVVGTTGPPHPPPSSSWGWTPPATGAPHTEPPPIAREGSSSPLPSPPPPPLDAVTPDVGLPDVEFHPGAAEVVEVPSRGEECGSSGSVASTSDDSTASLLPYDPRPPSPPGVGPEHRAGADEEVVWVHDGWLDEDDRLLFYGDYFFFYDSDDQLALLHSVHSSDEGDGGMPDHGDAAALSSCGRLLLLGPAGLCQPHKRRGASASFVRSSSSLPTLVGRASRSPPRDRSALTGKLYEYAVLP